MFDTMTMTKLTAALCGSLLIYLLGAWAAEEIYHAGAAKKDYATGKYEQAYAIDTGVEEVEEVMDEGPDFATLLASADIGKGEKAFAKCKACHALEAGDNGVGPYLYGVVGRQIAVADGFNYSGNLVKVAEVWTPENLDGFIENPKGWAPGTSMGFAGLRKPEDRANLIAYLDSLDD